MEALDFHGDLSAGFLRREGRALRTKVDERTLGAEARRKGIIGDRPTVGDQRGDDRVMVEVLDRSSKGVPWGDNMGEPSIRPLSRWRHRAGASA
jgi:hypothetical protein